jgi:hypothetical protein
MATAATGRAATHSYLTMRLLGWPTVSKGALFLKLSCRFCRDGCAIKQQHRRTFCSGTTKIVARGSTKVGTVAMVLDAEHRLVQKPWHLQSKL